MRTRPVALFLALCALAACSRPKEESSSTQVNGAVGMPVVTASKVASAWLGRWTGPEGTYLDVLEDGPGFKVAIRNLDGVRTFEAKSTTDGLLFERDGAKETIKAGAGKDTGMKWLQEKSNCLVVNAGEGYCRG
jgi:hypothetical protein